MGKLNVPSLSINQLGYNQHAGCCLQLSLAAVIATSNNHWPPPPPPRAVRRQWPSRRHIHINTVCVDEGIEQNSFLHPVVAIKKFALCMAGLSERELVIARGYRILHVILCFIE